MRNVTITASGGSDKAQYLFFSAGYLRRRMASSIKPISKGSTSASMATSRWTTASRSETHSRWISSSNTVRIPIPHSIAWSCWRWWHLLPYRHAMPMAPTRAVMDPPTALTNPTPFTSSKFPGTSLPNTGSQAISSPRSAWWKTWNSKRCSSRL